MMEQPAAKTSGIHFPPPLLYVAHFLSGMLLDRWIPLPVLPRAPSRLVAAVLLLPGFVLIFWSLWLFLRARTSPLPMRPTTAIVRSGPYRFTRNPMYLGMLLLYLGVAFLFDVTWALVLAPAVVVLVNRLEWEGGALSGSRIRRRVSEIQGSGAAMDLRPMKG